MTENDKKIQDVSMAKFDIPSFNEWSTENLKEYMRSAVDDMHAEKTMKKSLIKNINAVPDNANMTQKSELEKAAIVMYVIHKTVFAHASEVMKGAHIMIQDDGALYDALKERDLVQSRMSSHHKVNKADSDVSMQGGEIFREFLVGKTKDGKTWFQVEGHSTGGLANFIGHMMDYLKYKITGKNVGQYGLSKHVDSNPIQILKPHLDEIRTGIATNISPNSTARAVPTHKPNPAIQK